MRVRVSFETIAIFRFTMIDERLHAAQRLLAGERLCDTRAIKQLHSHCAIQSIVLPPRMQEQHA